MEISEVRVKLVERPGERLRAFCSITLDHSFVIRDLKIIGGASGAFVAMPSRKLADRCPRCGCKNHLRAKYCNECGAKLNEGRAPRDTQGRAKLHADVAHPINASCRERIQAAVMEAFEEELERSKSPDYKPTRFDDLDDLMEDTSKPVTRPEPASEPQAASEPEPASEPQAASEPESTPSADAEEEPGESAEESLSDYNSLIADLKQDAADRNRKRRERSSGLGGFGQGVGDAAASVEPAPEPASDRSEPEGEHRPRGRLDDRDRAREDTQPEAATERVEAEEPADQPEPVVAEPEPATTSPERAETSDDSFGAGIL